MTGTNRTLTRCDDGTWLYVPGGSDNIFSRRAYLVPDDATAERVRELTRGGYRFTLAGVLAMLVILAALAAWRPWNMGSGVMALLVFAGLLGVMPIPVIAGQRVARRLGLAARPKPRTLAEIAEPFQEQLGPGWLLVVITGLCLVVLGLLVAFSASAIAKGEGMFALFLGLFLVPGFTLAPLALFGLRTRRLAAANARLEALVGERTKQLVEVNARLQTRVAEQVAQLGRLGHLRHFFAAPVAEMILGQSGFDPARVHRKELTVVSIDLRGFTAFSETAEPEEVIAVLRRYHTELGRLVNHHQATLEHFAGENAMIFLNDPLEMPDHPARALRLALELRESIAPLLAEWRLHGYDLGLASGIASGYATIGTVGYEGRWEYAAIGSVCNLAARLCGAAHDGQVLTTHRVLSRAGAAFRTEPVGELSMKGISRPVAGFNVLPVPQADRQPG
jgi:class 3 adenylate cyclase